MLIVNENTREIQLTRGDTARLTVIPKYEADDSEYVLQSGDTLKLTLKKRTRDDEFVLQKIITNAEKLFHIEPKDTAKLSFGKYVYDVQLTTEGGDVYTIIPPSVFEIMEEVG